MGYGMKYWLWNYIWFPLNNPRKALCDWGVLLCHKDDCGNECWYRARRLVKAGYYK
jgi:hypothetical protein